MKVKLKKYFSFIIVASYSTLLFGCKSKIEAPQTVYFHIGDMTIEATNIDGFFNVDFIEKDNNRFIGWSTDSSKEHILTNSKNVPEHVIIEKFGDKNVDLYAIYANVLTVNFVLDNVFTVKLDSELNNIENVPDATKYGFEFIGWKTEDDLINLSPKTKTITYSQIEPLVKDKTTVDFYPTYEQLNIKLYQYNIADQMAEIHIETKNHLPIDDSSLIIPNEHKGKNGELPVYDYIGANISVDHCEDEYILNNVSGKVKVRGNYTSSYDKKPIRIKFDKKQKMLGLNNDNELKSWVLLANWKDSSMLRDASAFYLANALLESDGYYSSDFRFVKVYLNDSYNGVYLLVEQQQINKYRVNIPESKDSEDSPYTGYLLEYDGYYKNEKENQKFTIFYNDITNGNNGFTISNDIMNIEQYNFIKKVIQNIWKVVYDACKKSHTNLTNNPYHTIDENGDYITDTNIQTSKEAVEKVIDTRSLVDMYILHEILEDRDIGFSSFYFSIDFSEFGNKKLTFNAPWDFDYAIGNSTFQNSMRATISTAAFNNAGRLDSTGKRFKANTVLSKEDFTFKNEDSLFCENTDNPWFIVFSKEDWLWHSIFERWFEAKKANVFSSLLEMIELTSNKYTNEFKENFDKWPKDMGLKINDYQPTIVTYFVTQKQASDFLKIWLETRIEGLSTAFNKKQKF